jgi:hypothetical protein
VVDALKPTVCNGKRVKFGSRGGGAEMLKLKGCPKCKTGDIAPDRDYYGQYEYCIQCGYIRDLVNVSNLDQHKLRGVKKRKRKTRALNKRR